MYNCLKRNVLSNEFETSLNLVDILNSNLIIQNLWNYN